MRISGMKNMTVHERKSSFLARTNLGCFGKGVFDMEHPV